MVQECQNAMIMNSSCKAKVPGFGKTHALSYNVISLSIVLSYDITFINRRSFEEDE